MPYYLPIAKITLKGEFKAEGQTGANNQKDSTTKKNESKKTDAAEQTVSSSDHTGSEQVEVASNSPSPSPKQNPANGPTATKPPANSTDTSGTDTSSTTVTAGGWTITLTAEIEADKTAPRYAIPTRHYAYDDEYHVTVNSKHLLTAGTTTAEDRTADIVGAVASLVSEGINMAFLAGQPRNFDSFYLSFHTNNNDEFTKVQKQLQRRWIFLDIDSKPVAESKNVRTTAATKTKGTPDADEAQGLAFRLAAPYTITLRYPCNTNGCSTGDSIDYTHQFLLPDPEHTYVFDYARMPFVKKVTEIGFTNGMLTDFHETLPSPILGFLGIPKAMLAAIVPLPSSVNAGGTGTKAATGGSR